MFRVFLIFKLYVSAHVLVGPRKYTRGRCEIPVFLSLIYGHPCRLSYVLARTHVILYARLVLIKHIIRLTTGKAYGSLLAQLFCSYVLPEVK